MSEKHTHAHEKSGSVLRITINLAITCLVSGIILAVAYYLTHPIAVEKAKMLETMSMQSLVPDAETFKEVEAHEGMFAAEKADGSVVAYVVSVAPKGYGGAIEILVAVTTDGKVIDYTINKHNETPGLGSKASEPKFKDQFAGKTSEHLIVVKDVSNKDDIQAMTGATITSKAVTKGIKEAVDEVVVYTGGK